MTGSQYTPTKHETFEMALTEWGWEIQSLVFVEEMAEVIKEIIKIHRAIYSKKPLDLTKFVKEMADMKLMFDQISYDFSDKEKDDFQREYGLKLARAREWLEEGVPG